MEKLLLLDIYSAIDRPKEQPLLSPEQFALVLEKFYTEVIILVIIAPALFALEVLVWLCVTLSSSLPSYLVSECQLCVTGCLLFCFLTLLELLLL